MSWTADVYPHAMKNLEPRVRDKAINIANALIEDDYHEGLAIAIAIAQAKTWADKGPTADYDYHVVPHPEGWAVRCEESQHASFVSYSKEIARTRAIEFAAYWGVSVIIHAADGTIDPLVAAHR